VSCNHLFRKEYNVKRLFTAQVCQKCGAVREYNPQKKRKLITIEKHYPTWSEWFEDDSLKKALETFNSHVK
jgi:hypothetical protein